MVDDEKLPEMFRAEPGEKEGGKGETSERERSAANEGSICVPSHACIRGSVNGWLDKWHGEAGKEGMNGRLIEKTSARNG